METSHSVVQSPRVPQRGPYSQAVRVGELIFVAGQAGLDPATGTVIGPKHARPLRIFGPSWRTPEVGLTGS